MFSVVQICKIFSIFVTDSLRTNVCILTMVRC